MLNTQMEGHDSYHGYFMSKTVRVVGLDIHNNIFAEGDHIRIFAQDDNSVKVMLENHVPFKILGYLHHEDAKPIHTVLMKYENTKKPKVYMSTNGCTLEVGVEKEVLI